MCYIWAMAGYSGTPLVKKLGIKEQSKVVLLGAPPGLLAELPAGVTLRRDLRGAADVVLAFLTTRVKLEEGIAPLGRTVFPKGGLWIAWPKRASGLETDISDHVVREVALPLGLVDNKVCAVDDIWTGLRLVWRVEHRDARRP
jgi:hypothetical protein